MSAIGYHRVTFAELAPNSVTNVDLYVDNEYSATKKIISKELCSGGRLLKYLDRNGQYRFWGFNSFYEERLNVDSVGSSNELITSILTAQSDKRNLGNKMSKEISLMAENVSETELLIFSQLYYSPRIYLYIGNGENYSNEFWLLVTIKNSDNIVKPRKNKFSNIEVVIELPENKSIGML